MIVRIMGEGQFEVDETSMQNLNSLDDALTTAVESGDEGSFRAALSALLAEVRSSGTPLAPDALVDSDLVLPFEDAHIDEVRGMLSGEGLIPG
ncbi:MAG: hypothetical protein ICV70_01740 [Jiangellaceae bacterium]|nr:hypothetical protein [Jiangellaceae bacterium]